MTLPPKGDKGKSKAASGSKEASAPSSEELEYEITRWDNRVVYCSNSTFSDLSLKELRVRWRRAMGQLVGNKDFAQLASIYAKTRETSCLPSRPRYELARSKSSLCLCCDFRCLISNF